MPERPAVRARPAGVAVGAVVVVAVLLAGLVLAPLRHAGLHTDDWAWLALAAQVDSPWPAYGQGLMFGYFYRPTAFVAWVAAERLFGDHAALHYLASLLVHGLTAGALAAWLRACGVRAGAIAVALAVVTLAPATTGLVLWASNRNEALAVLFGLLALRSACAEGRGPALLTLALLVLSTSAKETGLLFAMAVAAQGLVRRDGPLLGRWPVVVVPLVAVALVFGVRQAIVLPIDPAAGGEMPLSAVLAKGLAGWWMNAPRALFGVEGTAAIAVAGATSAIVAIVAAWRARAKALRPVAVAAALFLLLPALVQSPITSIVLGDPASPMPLVNLRFFAIGTLGVALLAACAWPARGAWRLAAGVLLAGAVAMMATASHRNAGQWSAETQGMHIDAARIAAVVARAVPAPAGACLVDVRGVGLVPGARPYLDAMLRRHVAKDDPLARCVFAADGALPYVAFLPLEACAPTAWSDVGLGVATLHGRPYVDTLAGACQIILRPAAAGLRPSAIVDLAAAGPADAAPRRWPLH